MGNRALAGMRRRTLAAAAALGIALCVGMLAAPASTAANAAAAPLCGSMAGAAPQVTKVLWIVMENRSYGAGASQIPGDKSASYIDGTLLPQCGSTSDYHGVSHPSYPGYLAATSGSTQGPSATTSASIPRRASSPRSTRRGAATRSSCRPPATISR